MRFRVNRWLVLAASITALALLPFAVQAILKRSHSERVTTSRQEPIYDEDLQRKFWEHVANDKDEDEENRELALKILRDKSWHR
jgi:hypothetical protein